MPYPQPASSSAAVHSRACSILQYSSAAAKGPFRQVALAVELGWGVWRAAHAVPPLQLLQPGTAEFEQQVAACCCLVSDPSAVDGKQAGRPPSP